MSENTAILYDDFYKNIDRPCELNKHFPYPTELALKIHVFGISLFGLVWYFSDRYLLTSSSSNSAISFFRGNKLGRVYLTFFAGWLAYKASIKSSSWFVNRKSKVNEKAELEKRKKLYEENKQKK